MPDDIKVPGLGNVPKKYAIGAVVTAAGLGVIVYIRSRKAAQSAATAGTADATATTDPNAIDPATGIPYSQESGSYSYGTDNYGGAGAGQSGYDNSGYPIGSAADLMYQHEQVSGIATNDQWVQQAMSGSVPGDPGAIQAALSGVLGGLTVTTAQKNLFLEAVGVLGQPPGGYPTPVKTSDTAGHPGAGTPAAQVPVPNVAGQPQEAAFAIISEAGLHPAGTPVVHGKILYVVSQSPKAGTKVSKGTTVSVTSRVR